MRLRSLKKLTKLTKIGNLINVKNRRYLLIMCISILVIVALVIAFYAPSDRDDVNPFIEPVDDVEFTEKTFNVIGTERTTGMTIDGAAFKTYNEPIVIDVFGGVLTNIYINLTWHDDHIYGLSKAKGLDTLTAEITYKDGSQKLSSIGDGSMSFDVFKINSEPILTSVLAKNFSDAEEKLQSILSGKNKASLNTNIEVCTGEKLCRPLKWLKDKGNDFKIDVTYTYYTFNVE